MAQGTLQEPVTQSAGFSSRKNTKQAEDDNEEKSNLVGLNTWTRKDKMIMFMNLFMKVGDAIEIYLPGIVTQIISCEMGVTKAQEGWLGIAFYIALTVSTVITAPISNRCGRRPVLIFSLYISIIANFFCSIVPENYYFILASRLSVGFCVGLNISTSSVFVAENVSSHRVYCTAVFIDSFFFAAGSGWVALLGYFLLGTVGWRVFILFTSLPIFLPPIILLHCCLKDETGPSYKPLRTSESGEGGIQIRQEQKVESAPNFKMRLFKASVMNFLNLLQGFGCILLLPALLRKNNEKEGETSEKCQSSASVQGEEFLVIALITGGCILVGRLLGLWVSNRFRFWVIQSFLAVILIACYGTLLFDNSYIAVLISMGVANIVMSMTRLELKIMECDINHFGRDKVAVASAIILGVGFVGSILGTSLAGFLAPQQAVLWTFVFSCFLLFSALSIREYKN